MRIKFSTGVRGLAVGSKLLFRYKKYLFDKSKKMDQSGLDELRAEEALNRGSEDENEDGVVSAESNEGKGDVSNYVQIANVVEESTEKVVVEEKVANSSGDIKDGNKNLSAVHEAASVEEPASSALTTAVPLQIQLPPPFESASVVTAISTPAPVVRTTFTPLSTLLSQISVSTDTNKNPATTTNSTNTAAPIAAHVRNSNSGVDISDNPMHILYPAGTSAETHTRREGIVESTKIEDSSEIVTVKGAFRMEENIRLHTGAVAVSGALENGVNSVGSLVGPFGKMGKCKVKFEKVGQAGAVGDTVHIFTIK